MIGTSGPTSISSSLPLKLTLRVRPLSASETRSTVALGMILSGIRSHGNWRHAQPKFNNDQGPASYARLPAFPPAPRRLGSRSQHPTSSPIPLMLDNLLTAEMATALGLAFAAGLMRGYTGFGTPIFLGP